MDNFWAHNFLGGTTAGNDSTMWPPGGLPAVLCIPKFKIPNWKIQIVPNRSLPGPPPFPSFPLREDSTAIAAALPIVLQALHWIYERTARTVRA